MHEKSGYFGCFDIQVTTYYIDIYRNKEYLKIETKVKARQILLLKDLVYLMILSMCGKTGLDIEFFKKC
jgi:hypothetical protein